MPTTTSDRAIAEFFRENYIRWAVGQLDPRVEQELDELSPPGWENWKNVMERENGFVSAHFQHLQTLLCESTELSGEEALAVLLRTE